MIFIEDRIINVRFTGQLRDEQLPAASNQLKYDNGVLNAALHLVRQSYLVF